MSTIELFNQYQKSLSFVAKKYTKCIEDAEDVLQESAIKIWSKRDAMDNISNVRAWMMTVVRNTAIDMYRRKLHDNVTCNSPYISTLEIPDEDDDDRYYREIPMSVVMNAIHNLSPAYQKAMKMYLLDGLSHQEISNALGVSVGTSKSNLSKAKKNVIKYIKNEKIF